MVTTAEEKDPQVVAADDLINPPLISEPDNDEPSAGGASVIDFFSPLLMTPAVHEASPSDSAAKKLIEQSRALIAQNKLVEARRVLAGALEVIGLTSADADQVRSELTTLNEKLVFSPLVVASDPFAISYVVEPGDVLSRLPKKMDIFVDWRFVQRINGISSPERLRAGQRIKLVRGPFHAVIDKHDYRLDLFLGQGPDRVYVRSFPIGIGESGSTPEGRFTVKPNSRIINPEWVNPRTGERFRPDDPNNPIGEHWIGLIGASDTILDLEGYGIHGTIEPESIGRQLSMGCIRMLPDDVALIYEVLLDNVSVIEIHGDDYP